MNVVIDKVAKEGFWAIARDKRLGKKLEQLLDDISRHPFTGIGKPELLKGRPGQWSRRIDEYHRLVYKIENDEIKILECGKHYEG
jgi:toxin YoeB